MLAPLPCKVERCHDRPPHPQHASRLQTRLSNRFALVRCYSHGYIYRQCSSQCLANYKLPVRTSKSPGIRGVRIQTLGYLDMCPTPPFPAFAFASGLTRLGISLANGQANGFLGSLKKNMHIKLGIYHGCHGTITLPLQRSRNLGCSAPTSPLSSSSSSSVDTKRFWQMQAKSQATTQQRWTSTITSSGL